MIRFVDVASMSHKGQLWKLALPLQGSLDIPEDATYDDYLALKQPEDEVTEVPIDPYSMDSPRNPLDKVRLQALLQQGLYQSFGLLSQAMTQNQTTATASK